MGSLGLLMADFVDKVVVCRFFDVRSCQKRTFFNPFEAAASMRIELILFFVALVVGLSRR
jgi:hypothetical protein